MLGQDRRDDAGDFGQVLMLVAGFAASVLVLVPNPSIFSNSWNFRLSSGHGFIERLAGLSGFPPLLKRQKLLQRLWSGARGKSTVDHRHRRDGSRCFPARLDFIRSQPTFRGGPFDLIYPMSASRVGDGHEVIDDPLGRPDMPAQEIIDRLGRLHDLGVTVSGVPTPPLDGVEAYLDHLQWVMEEIKPKVP